MGIVPSTLVRALLLLTVLCGIALAQAQPDDGLHYSPQRERMAIELRTRTQALHFIAAGWDIAVLLLLMRWQVARKLRDRTRSTFAVAAGVLAILSIAALPIAMYRHTLVLHYGLSIQSWPSWFWDWTKEFLLSGIVSVLLVAGGYALARRTRRWWLWAWAAGMVFMFAAAYIVPWIVDPLFNRFRPLAEKHAELVPKLQQVASRAGISIPPERMFEMEASEKSRTVNAYLTGLGASKRIVLWDTTIQTLTPEQVQTVFAHELGHYVFLHVPKSLVLGSLGLLIVLFALSRLLGADARDAASLVRALLFVAIIGFLSEPVVNGYSRWQEHQADVFELETMRGLVTLAGRNSAEVDLIMSDINLEHPRPNRFVTFWLYDHPPSAERIRYSLAFDNKNVR